MAQPELIDAVRRASAETAAGVWAEARAESARCREEAQRAAAQTRARLDLQLRASAAGALRTALLDAERRSRGIRGAARSALADRLAQLARASLPALRDDSYAVRFRALANELPRRAWHRVTVNPADVEIARQQLAGCVIETDASITGGLVAEGDGLRVTNTFDSRLRAAWPEMQPEVLNDVLDHHKRAQPAA